MALKQLFTFVSVFTLNKDTGTLHFTILLWWYLIQSGFLTKSPWKNELTEQGEISLAVMEKGAFFFLFYVSVHFVFVSLFKRVRKTLMWDHAWLYVRCEGIRQWSQMLVHVEDRGTDSWRHIEIGNIWGLLISEGYTFGAWWCVQKWVWQGIGSVTGSVKKSFFFKTLWSTQRFVSHQGPDRCVL